MSKFTDALRNTLQGYFDPGDQPTSAQFDALILAIQEGIEEHDHDGTGDGDGIATLGGVLTLDAANARVGIETLAPAYLVEIADDGTGVHLTRGTLDMRWAGANDGPGYFGCESNDDLYVRTNAITRINIAAAGAVKITDLAGVGSRNVVAAADGTLSAP